MPTINYSELNLGVEIGEGANAFIYEVDTVNGVSSSKRLVFKKYKTSPKKIELDNLIELIRFRDTLNGQDRALLDSAILWPTDLVESGGQIVGNIMERLPDAAMETVAGKTEAIGIVSLMGRERHCAANDVKGRLRIVSGMVYCVAVLHKLGVVYGDLSPANAVLIPSSGRVLLVDSDVCKVPNSPVGFVQAHTYPLTPPEQRNRLDSQSTQAGDVFKLAEMAARMMLNRAQLVDPDEVYDDLISAFGSAIGDGLGFGMSADPSDRPGALELYSTFYSAIAGLMRPPKISSVTVSPYGVVEGQSATVSWQGVGLVDVEIIDPCGEPIAVPSGASSITVPVQATGKFQIVARNVEGEITVLSPRVICVDRPSVESVEVPELFGVTRAISGMGDAERLAFEAAIDASISELKLGVPSYSGGVRSGASVNELEPLPSMNGIFENEIIVKMDSGISLEGLNSSNVNSALVAFGRSTEMVLTQVGSIFKS